MSKHEDGMIELKKTFSNIVNKMQAEFKANNLSYKQKYLQITKYLNDLYTSTKKCYEGIEQASDRPKRTSTGDASNQGGKSVELDPLALVEYIRQFCFGISQYLSQWKKKQKQIKSEILLMIQKDKEINFLEALARKNLDNYDLKLRVEELEAELKAKQRQCKLIERSSMEYQRKFQQYQKDYNLVIVSIASLLKQSETCEVQLRQENRLQKELIQSHKIQFERFKTDFKLRPTFEEKLAKAKQIIEKKYQDREEILIKQSEKLVENRLKVKVK